MRFAKAAQFTALFAISSWAQTYPATITLPVTYYDHLAYDDMATCGKDAAKDGDSTSADKTGAFTPYTPGGDDIYREFNMCQNGARQNGCVKKELIDGVPAFNSQPSLYNNGCPGCCWYNNQVKEWFKNNDRAVMPTSLLPQNVVIPDSLLFTHLGNGIYEYSNGNFFPLNGRGLVANGMEQPLSNGNNYGFTMHLQRSYVFTDSNFLQQTICFQGDDDAWIFVNGVLVMDVGGIHGAITEQFTFAAARDSLAKYGKEFKIKDSIKVDFFYAERRVIASSLRIQIPLQFICIDCYPTGLPRPTFNPPSGTIFTYSQVVAITGRPGSTLHYQVNNEPWVSELWKSTAQITLAGTSTIKAYLTQTNWLPTDTTAAVYTYAPNPPQFTILRTGSQDQMPPAMLSPADSNFEVRLRISSGTVTSAVIKISSKSGETFVTTTSTYTDDASGRIFRYTIPINFSGSTTTKLDVLPIDTVVINYTDRIYGSVADTFYSKPLDVENVKKPSVFNYDGNLKLYTQNGKFVWQGKTHHHQNIWEVIPKTIITGIYIWKIQPETDLPNKTTATCKTGTCTEASGYIVLPANP